jgi:hypothetical protein
MNAITQDHIDDQTLDGTNLVFDATGTPLGVTFNGINSFVKDQDAIALYARADCPAANPCRH